MTARVERSMRAARGATVSVCNAAGEHKGQGLLLRLDGAEGTVILTCYHVAAAVDRRDLRVKLPSTDGTLEGPNKATYDGERSRPEQDAAVLRVQEDVLLPATPRPLLHKLDADTYGGSLKATVLTRLIPDNFDVTVRPSTLIDVTANPDASWLETPGRYRLRVFRLADATDSRPGFSGGVVFCEGGVLGLAHFGREESKHTGREDYLVPLCVWVEGWPALEELIEPLVDEKLRASATVKRSRGLSAGVGADVVVAGYRTDVYAERNVDALARRALDEHDGVIVIGRPLSGKSRLAVQLLLDDPRAVVVIPRPHSPAPPEGFEASGFVGESAVLFFDDLHRTAGTSQVLAWRRVFEEATGRPCKVVCTCRDGGDWRSVEIEQAHLLRELGDGATVFTSRVGEPGHQAGEDLSLERGRELADELGMGAAEFGRRFDGTPGSLLLDLADMRRRYEALRNEERGGVSMSRLLDSAKLFYRAHLPMLPGALVKAAAERIRGSGPIDPEVWDSLVRRTSEEGFAQFDEETGDLLHYAPYLERCVLYEPSRQDFESIAPLMQEAEDVVGLFFLVGFYGQILNDNERALSLAERAIEIDPDFAPSWYNKGYSLNNLGRHDEALEALEHAISLDPEYESSYYSKGVALSGLNRHQEALEPFREAVRRGSGLRPDAAVSMYLDGLAGCLDSLGRFHEAVWSWHRSLALYPPYRPAVARFCDFLCRAGEPSHALKVAEDALAADNEEFAEAWYGKGMALTDLGRHEESLRAYDRAIALHPHFPQAWWGKGVLLLLMSTNTRGRSAHVSVVAAPAVEAHERDLARRALEAFDKLVALGHDDASVRMNRSVALTRLGRHAEALASVNSALAIEPENPQIQHNKEEILQRVKR